MSVMVLRLDVVLSCPCAQSCRNRSPLDELAERLRAEMRFGRDHQPTTFPDITVVMVAFYVCPERN